MVCLVVDCAGTWVLLIIMYHFLSAMICSLFVASSACWAWAQTPVASNLFDVICGGGFLVFFTA